MSTLKSINWALAWRRSIWTVFFAAFYAIVVYMAKDMAGTQPVIFGIILLAAIVCAVAFVYSKESKEALLIAVLALSVHTFLEISYWSAVVDDTSVQAMREQAAASSRDLVNEKRRTRYASSASGKSAAQIKAEIEALKQDKRWSSSEQCSAATADNSRAYCRQYHLLVADLAAADEAARLEQTVFHTTVETVDIPRNLAKGALWLSDVTGMSVQTATNIIVGMIVLFIQSGLAGCLRIGWKPQRPAMALGRPEALPTTDAAPRAFTPALPLSPRAELRPYSGAMAKLAGVAKVNSSEIPISSPDHSRDVANMIPDPDGPGTPAPAPEEPKIEEAADISNVFPLKGYHDSAAGWRIEKDVPAKRSKKRAQETSVSRWLRGFDVRDLTPGEVKAGKGFFAKDYLRKYETWCQENKEKPFKIKRFSAVLRGELDQPKKRRAGGQRFNVALEPVMAIARQRVA